MSEIWIRWDQRAAGREVGHVEEVEKTDFVKALIEQGRVTVIDAPKEEAPVEQAPALLGVVVPEPVEETAKPKAAKKAAHSEEE